MESTGEALKIHCSAECRRLLETLGGYVLVERGALEVKGKGLKITHWLIGETARRKRNNKLPAPRSSMKKVSPRRSPIRKLRFANSMETINDDNEHFNMKNKESSASCSCVDGLLEKKQPKTFTLSAPVINDWEDNLPLLSTELISKNISPV